MADTHRTARVLLVEDEAITLLQERRTLVKGGYDVVPIRRGADAVETARNASGIDMLVTDIDLGPGMDGIEVAKEILGFKPMPVLFLTSSEESAIEEQARDIGDYSFLRKGATQEDFLETVEKALAGRSP